MIMTAAVPGGTAAVVLAGTFNEAGSCGADAATAFTRGILHLQGVGYLFGRNLTLVVRAQNQVACTIAVLRYLCR